MSRYILAKIDLNAFKNNLSIIKKLSPKTFIWSVIKSNAYGHSLYSVLIGLQKTDGFALLDLEEAIFLRKLGCQKPILLLSGFFCLEDLSKINKYRLYIVIHNFWQLELLKKIEIKFPINIYVKLNSGMNRLGFNYQNFLKVWKQIKNIKNINSMILISHFSHSTVEKKIEKEMRIIEKTCKSYNIKKSCLANSAAILWSKNTHKKEIRPGILLYGSSPTGNWKDICNYGFKPVMTLQSRIISIQEVKKGDFIGYEGKYYVKKNMKIGIVCCGYSDGYPRNAPIGTPVLVDRNFTEHIVGMVSMNMLIISLSSIPNPIVGLEVELWGKNIKIDKIAKLCNTTSYQIFTNISNRIKYLYD